MKNKIRSYGEIVSKSLEPHGWTHLQILPEEGWGDENWVFESRWRPVGFKFFLSFVADPEYFVFIGMLRAGENIPNYFNCPDGEISVLNISRGWTGHKLQKFVEDINTYRDQAHESARKIGDVKWKTS